MAVIRSRRSFSDESTSTRSSNNASSHHNRAAQARRVQSWERLQVSSLRDAPRDIVKNVRQDATPKPLTSYRVEQPSEAASQQDVSIKSNSPALIFPGDSLGRSDAVDTPSTSTSQSMSHPTCQAQSMSIGAAFSTLSAAKLAVGEFFRSNQVAVVFSKRKTRLTAECNTWMQGNLACTEACTWGVTVECGISDSRPHEWCVFTLVPLQDVYKRA